MSPWPILQQRKLSIAEHRERTISTHAYSGWAKLNSANVVSFIVVKHVSENFDNFCQVKLRTLRSIKNKYFSPEGATKANDFLCSSILAALLNHNFYFKMILLTNNFYDGPTMFNTLPDDLRDPAVSTSTFRQSLKTHLFSAYQHV